MKKLVLAAAIAATFASGAVQAEEIAPGHDLSFNVAATSDYIFRGQTQSDGGMAISGGADYTHSSGFYAGTWMSSVEFNDSADMEVDLYLGYAGEFGGDFSYDVGVVDYIYPDDGVDNTWEAYVSIGYKNFSAKYSHTLTDYFGVADSSGSGYIEANADFDIGAGFGLGLHVGHQDIDDSGSEDYTDYGITLSKSYVGMDFSLALTDTDLDSGPNDDARVSFTVSKSF